MQGIRISSALFLVGAIVAAKAMSAPASSQPVVVYTKQNAPSAPKVDELPLRESVSQYGITWTFEKKLPVGQFINGDYYVVGPTTVKMIDPKPLWGPEVKEIINKDDVREGKYPGKQARNGSSLNPPSKAKTAGFDSRIPSNRYDPALFAHLPITMKPGDALVSTISRRNDELTKFGGQHVDPLRVAAVLTCLGEPLPPDALRPSYCDCAHSKIFLARNLRRELLVQVPRPAGAPASLDDYANVFQKPWLDLADFGFAAPQENLPHYGQQMVEKGGEASLLLLMDYSPQDKERLLMNFVQVGIDLWGVARGGFVWQAHGGLNSGRKWPIVFAGIMFNDSDMQSPTKVLPKLRFHEDDQTTLCPVTWRWKDASGQWKVQTFGQSWTGAKAIFLGHSPYLMARDSHWMDGWGLLDVFPPAQWPLKERGSIRASEGYRRANTSGAWVAQALAVRMLHAERTWDHDAFFAYVDRWMTEDDTAHVQAIKEAGFSDMTKIPPHTFTRQGHITGAKWVREMWDKHRNNLPTAPDGHQDPPAEKTWR